MSSAPSLFARTVSALGRARGAGRERTADRSGAAPEPQRGRPGRHLLRVAGAVVAVAALTALPALPAQAHDSLSSSSPASGATVTTAPHAVTLGFEEAVLDSADATVLIVTGPDAATRHFETGCVRIDGSTVSAPVALGADGRYTVTWRVVSDDGHPVTGSFGFTLHRAGGGTPSAGSASGPACGRAGGGTESATSGGAGSASALSPAVWVLIGVGGGLVLLLLIALIVVAVVLSRRPAKAEAGSGPGTA